MGGRSMAGPEHDMMDRHRLVRTAAVLIIAAGAWVLRTELPAGRVFPDGDVHFQGDATYHMRVVDHLVANFPHRLTVDPYAAPGGEYIAIAPLFDYLAATLALVIGGGSPSDQVVERVGALLPPTLGALATVLVFLLGRRLFDARAGLTGAALLAVVPGSFLHRTLAGEADHHAAEVVLVLLTLLLAVVTVQRACRDPRLPLWRHPAAWLAGLSLGAYCLTWTSAALFVAALGLWFVLQLLIDERVGRSTSVMTGLAVIMGATALACVLAFQNPRMFRYESQVAALGGLVLLGGTARLGEHLLRRTGRSALTPMALTAAAALVAAAAAAVMFPSVTAGILQDLLRLEPDPAGRLVTETQPLMRMTGHFSWRHPWNAFGPIFFVGIPALGALAIKVRRDTTREHALLLVWGVVAFAATLGQNRFGYYLAPVLALLAGWAVSSAWSWPVMRFRRAAAVTLAALMLLPSLRMAIAEATRERHGSDALRLALLWMRDHTPDPFGDSAVYLARYDDATPPRAAYSVMNWADDGYDVVRVARRVPVANPAHTRIVDAARFFTSTSEGDALSILAANRSRYVIVTRDLALLPTPSPATLFGKFESLAYWAGAPGSQFIEGMFERDEAGQLVPAWVFHPDYYRSMAVRMSLYGASSSTPHNSTWVITYADQVTPAGQRFREIVESRLFRTYREAEAARAALGSGPHLLVGRRPLQTAVPLEPLEVIRPIHDEHDVAHSLPAVRIFAADAAGRGTPPSDIR